MGIRPATTRSGICCCGEYNLGDDHERSINGEIHSDCAPCRAHEAHNGQSATDKCESCGALIKDCEIHDGRRLAYYSGKYVCYLCSQQMAQIEKTPFREGRAIIMIVAPK